ncbi:hypothetical protein PHYBLDRAFT_61653 [Phycomyces blakesleeanus NRRL 1555(-)]|uniref:Uncharacterized protein n=1 Tax=Phycomyces blakesleeanus (strain ATCC 8743b / DSM 1359 / FGSC 10004 / NBRC 33097 / NRRL 1555) TaxID=763407 RepID=A0A163BCE8_PHYB8|nr:hypothetical protein PHYBLDRAFT_61653 [Phycomyces blakesleeanus NRRL 1555(-)]OAD80601.1 hypothetical protein PHYBLDRAFT_61653 [Phycomyces blakesleeanus NRRL 1555(-)]|eukprot:XP_018298641.1 hypothetical protein PHYBLDRAFT_61653 [Phycomyces blakesleeanus NRRL 1555(-)]
MGEDAKLVGLAKTIYVFNYKSQDIRICLEYPKFMYFSYNQEELLDSDIFFKRQKLCRKCQYKKTVAHGHGESVSEKNCASSLFVVTFPTKFLTFEKVRCSNLIAGEEKY